MRKYSSTSMVKFSNVFIRDVVLRRLGVRDADVVVGPGVGEDAAVVKIDGKYLATHVDPVTGSSNLLGWLAIHVAANDIATRGIRPRWFLLTLIMPMGSGEGEVAGIMSQVNDALTELNAMLIGGHTEKSDAVTRPIAVVTAIGVGDRYVRTGGLRVGDVIVMTKYAALEATSILASDFKDRLIKVMSREELKEAEGLYRMVSVVKEALSAIDYASSMHDPTEGGVLQGLVEMAYSSGRRIIVNEEDIPILPVTRRILSFFNLDPLTVLSSGSLLIGVSEDKASELISRLKNLGVNASVIGRVVDGEPGVVIRRSGLERYYEGDLSIPDGVIELWARGAASGA